MFEDFLLDKLLPEVTKQSRPRVPSLGHGYYVQLTQTGATLLCSAVTDHPEFHSPAYKSIRQRKLPAVPSSPAATANLPVTPRTTAKARTVALTVANSRTLRPPLAFTTPKRRSKTPPPRWKECQPKDEQPSNWKASRNLEIWTQSLPRVQPRNTKHQNQGTADNTVRPPLRKQRSKTPPARWNIERDLEVNAKSAIAMIRDSQRNLATPQDPVKDKADEKSLATSQTSENRDDQNEDDTSLDNKTSPPSTKQKESSVMNHPKSVESPETATSAAAVDTTPRRAQDKEKPSPSNCVPNSTDRQRNSSTLPHGLKGEDEEDETALAPPILARLSEVHREDSPPISANTEGLQERPPEDTGEKVEGSTVQEIDEPPGIHAPQNDTSKRTAVTETTEAESSSLTHVQLVRAALQGEVPGSNRQLGEEKQKQKRQDKNRKDRKKKEKKKKKHKKKLRRQDILVTDAKSDSQRELRERINTVVRQNSEKKQSERAELGDGASKTTATSDYSNKNMAGFEGTGGRNDSTGKKSSDLEAYETSLRRKLETNRHSSIQSLMERSLASRKATKGMGSAVVQSRADNEGGDPKRKSFKAMGAEANDLKRTLSMHERASVGSLVNGSLSSRHVNIRKEASTENIFPWDQRLSEHSNQSVNTVMQTLNSPDGHVVVYEDESDSSSSSEETFVSKPSVVGSDRFKVATLRSDASSTSATAVRLAKINALAQNIPSARGIQVKSLAGRRDSLSEDALNEQRAIFNASEVSPADGTATLMAQLPSPNNQISASAIGNRKQEEIPENQLNSNLQDSKTPSTNTDYPVTPPQQKESPIALVTPISSSKNTGKSY